VLRTSPVQRATLRYHFERTPDRRWIRAVAAGFDEVILYFNVGLKPHNQVKEEMDRFMHEVAPAFAGKHNTRAA